MVSLALCYVHHVKLFIGDRSLSIFQGCFMEQLSRIHSYGKIEAMLRQDQVQLFGDQGLMRYSSTNFILRIAICLSDFSFAL